MTKTAGKLAVIDRICGQRTGSACGFCYCEGLGSWLKSLSIIETVIA